MKARIARTEKLVFYILERPPRKKLLNAENLFKRERETSVSRLQGEELDSLKSTPIKKRWNPKRAENSQGNNEIQVELDGVRKSRPRTLEKVK